MGHEQVLTTFGSYGEVAPYRQAEIMKALGAPRVRSDELRELADRLAEVARREIDEERGDKAGRGNM